MSGRYRKPGYWIVALAILLPLGYYAYGQYREWAIRKAAFDRLAAFGNVIVNDIRDKSFYDLQSLFVYDEHSKPAIEDIALFISTAEVEKVEIEEWDEWSETNTTAILEGKLKTARTELLPIRLMMVKKPNGIFLKWVEIKDIRLSRKREGFPLNAISIGDLNISPASEANTSSVRESPKSP